MTIEDMHTMEEEKNKRRGMIISTIIHIAIVLLALLPILTFPDPPPGQEGILVNLGFPDEGEGFDNAGPSEPIAETDPLPEEETPFEETEVFEEEIPEPEAVEPDPAPEPEVIETEDPEEIALKREEERRKQEEADQRRREDEAKRKAEAERKRQEEEARQKAEAEAKRKAEADKFKDQIGGLFGDGKGKGNTGKEGNQGDPGGDPNSDILEGISTGSGQVGGGLGSRGILRAPKPEDSSQQTGTVVVEVCVDSKGNVISAEFTQRGSTTANAELVRIAETNAKKWKFSDGDADKQCGTITYSFRVR